MHTNPYAASTRLARGRTLALFLGLWAALVLVTSLAVYLAGMQRASGADLTRALRDVGAFFAGWVLLTPLIYRLSDRFRIAPPTRSALLVHFGASLLAVLSATALQGLLLLPGRGSGLTAAGYAEWLSASLWSRLASLPIYWVVVGVATAFLLYDLYRREETMRARLEASLAEAQVAALRSQLQPHFLFNTLNAIGVLIRSRRDEDARRMVAGLADLMRYTLDVQERSEVALSDELEFIRHYLAVHELRFEGRITTTIHAEEAALDALVPNLLLQPLVENALRHGLFERATPGTLTIEAVVRGGRLLIRIEDDGPGPEGALEELEQRGSGLRNIRARLAAHAGWESELRIQRRPAGGAVCELDLPVRYEEGAPAPLSVRSA